MMTWIRAIPVKMAKFRIYSRSSQKVTNGLNVKCKRRRRIKVSDLSNQKNRGATSRDGEDYRKRRFRGRKSRVSFWK